MRNGDQTRRESNTYKRTLQLQDPTFAAQCRLPYINLSTLTAHSTDLDQKTPSWRRGRPTPTRVTPTKQTTERTRNRDRQQSRYEKEKIRANVFTRPTTVQEKKHCRWVTHISPRNYRIDIVSVSTQKKIFFCTRAEKINNPLHNLLQLCVGFATANEPLPEYKQNGVFYRILESRPAQRYTTQVANNVSATFEQPSTLYR